MKLLTTLATSSTLVVVVVVSMMLTTATTRTLLLADAFAPPVPFLAHVQSSKSSQLYGSSAVQQEETEVERLLRKARELREQASQAEQEVHDANVSKKNQKDSHTDQLINSLFFDRDSGSTLVDCLRSKKLSMDTLEDVALRLDERQVIAEGRDHVHSSVDSAGRTQFERKAESARDEPELERLDGTIEQLIEALRILDDEFIHNKEGSKNQYVSSFEDAHLGGGKAAQRLENAVHEVRREREDQFLKRQEEFYEAQRIKKDRPAPRKVKDDHGFLP